MAIFVTPNIFLEYGPRKLLCSNEDTSILVTYLMESVVRHAHSLTHSLARSRAHPHTHADETLLYFTCLLYPTLTECKEMHTSLVDSRFPSVQMIDSIMLHGEPIISMRNP